MLSERARSSHHGGSMCPGSSPAFLTHAFLPFTLSMELASLQFQIEQ